MPGPLAAIFDLDGLLIETEHLWREAEREVFSSLGAVISDQLQNETASMTTREVTAFWHKRFPWADQTLISVEDAVVQRVKATFSRARPIQGATEFVHTLRRARLKIALASNSPEVLCRHALSDLLIADQFDVVVSSEHVTLGKPNPMIYLESARRLQTEPTRCVAFEDSLVGARAACAAGMQVVVVPSNIEDVPELEKLDVQMVQSLDQVDVEGTFHVDLC